MDRTKKAVATRLAHAHFEVEPGIVQIFQLLADDQVESDPKEPVKLLEVNRDTTEDGIRPVFFGAQPSSEIFYPSVIVEVTPEEFDQIRSGATKLPNNWRVGPELPRGARVGSGGR